ncbi:YtxH domain-containing protein [Bacillus sp. T33-2]|uniref:YtxH domain-containing protein n=1 Tax=Bacillus sp. T33-2 TaxID=2054168 RepID=UPI0015E09A01|nr:YtxH domain-containing protein [Bacillus sp. T33-2]
MSNSRRFWMGVLLGAVTGGALSLLNKSTRQSVKEDFKVASGSVAYIVKHPDEFFSQVKETAEQVRSTVQQVSEDVSYIAEKVEEMKDVPPQVAHIVEDTKKAFIHSGEGSASGNEHTDGQAFRTAAVVDTDINRSPEIH